ncbi:MAG: hypothetical protein R8K50_03405 [Mariprofundus sp.]
MISRGIFRIFSTISKTVAAETNAMMAAVAKLSPASEGHAFASTEEHMLYMANEVRSLMDAVRLHADALEVVVADDLWPLPKYREMLFIFGFVVLFGHEKRTA